MSQIVKHRKSNILDKVPNQSGMTYGEIFVNYASGNGKSFLATKKTDNTVAQFMEKSYNDATYSTKAEASEYAAVALANAKNYTNNVSGNIETTINNVSASIISYVSNGYSTTGALATANSKISALSGVVSSIAETYATKNEFQSFSASVLSEIENDEYTTSLALTTLNQNFDSLSSTVYTEINELSADITTANSKISELSGTVSSFTLIYPTKAEASEYAAAALANAYSDIIYLSGVINTLVSQISNIENILSAQT